jgi:hypothetical protein
MYLRFIFFEPKLSFITLLGVCLLVKVGILILLGKF